MPATSEAGARLGAARCYGFADQFPAIDGSLPDSAGGASDPRAARRNPAASNAFGRFLGARARGRAAMLPCPVAGMGISKCENTKPRSSKNAIIILM
jgi:hypothetical protein